MNTEQELDQREEAFTVTAGPVDMSDLQEGHVEDEWIRLQKLNSVKDEYEQTKLDSTLLREDILKENKEKLSKTCDALLQKYKVVSMVTEDQVQADVQALVKEHLTTAKNVALFELKDKEDDVLYQIRKIEISKKNKPVVVM
jgi:hypothetical protein